MARARPDFSIVPLRQPFVASHLAENVNGTNGLWQAAAKSRQACRPCNPAGRTPALKRALPAAVLTGSTYSQRSRPLCEAIHSGRADFAACHRVVRQSGGGRFRSNFNEKIRQNFTLAIENKRLFVPI